MQLESTFHISQTLDRDPVKPHHFASVGFVPRGDEPDAALLPARPHTSPSHSMTGNRDVRSDVERILDLRLRVEFFRVGSQMGRMAIHETRVGGKRCAKVSSTTETGDANERSEQRIATLRRAIYAPPARRRYRSANGEPMRNVIAGREVADIVRAKAGHASSSPLGALQDWASTIDTKLARLGRSCVFCRPISEGCKHVTALIEAARLRVRIEAVRATESVSSRELGSRTRRRRLGESGVRRETERRDEAKALGRALVVKRMAITRSTLYEEAIDLFDLACSENAETRAYCYRENE